ncbi:MAG: 16S rRNA (uracil(1498)-N(3))-methyltransferase [Legionellales bacterium]
MRTIRIYQPGDYAAGQQVLLSPEASQHVAVVLRMQPGEQLTLFCGDLREFAAVIETVNKKQVLVAIHAVSQVNKESPLSIQLAQVISKGDRMELVMQKAVELGVTSIVPLISDHCVVRLDPERMQKKVQQWQAIAIAACEQSGRTVVPMVHPTVTLEHYVHTVQAQLKLVLHPQGANTWRDYDLQSDIALLIGPEGGLNNKEIDLALAYGFHTLSLGPRVLRTETAAITALSVLQAVAGDL